MRSWILYFRTRQPLCNMLSVPSISKSTTPSGVSLAPSSSSKSAQKSQTAGGAGAKAKAGRDFDSEKNTKGSRVPGSCDLCKRRKSMYPSRPLISRPPNSRVPPVRCKGSLLRLLPSLFTMKLFHSGQAIVARCPTIDAAIASSTDTSVRTRRWLRCVFTFWCLS